MQASFKHMSAEEQAEIGFSSGRSKIHVLMIKPDLASKRPRRGQPVGHDRTGQLRRLADRRADDAAAKREACANHGCLGQSGGRSDGASSRSSTVTPPPSWAKSRPPASPAAR